MNYNTLQLDHFNFFCPATGVRILGEDNCDDSARSLIAYWIDEIFEEPVIRDPGLIAAWTKFSEKFTLENEDETPSHTELEQFLKDYRAPNWAVFEITTCGVSCGPTSTTGWFVIDMNTELTDDESPTSL